MAPLRTRLEAPHVAHAVGEQRAVVLIQPGIEHDVELADRAVVGVMLSGALGAHAELEEIAPALQLQQRIAREAVGLVDQHERPGPPLALGLAQQALEGRPLVDPVRVGALPLVDVRLDQRNPRPLGVGSDLLELEVERQAALLIGAAHSDVCDGRAHEKPRLGSLLLLRL